MTQTELTGIQGRVREHTGLIYRADLASLLEAGAENVRLRQEVEDYRDAANRLASENESLLLDRNRLDVIEREAGRRILVREEPDAEMCNIALTIPGDPIGGGVLSSLRDAADKILAEAES